MQRIISIFYYNQSNCFISLEITQWKQVSIKLLLNSTGSNYSSIVRILLFDTTSRNLSLLIFRSVIGHTHTIQYYSDRRRVSVHAFVSVCVCTVFGKKKQRIGKKFRIVFTWVRSNNCLYKQGIILRDQGAQGFEGSAMLKIGCEIHLHQIFTARLQHKLVDFYTPRGLPVGLKLEAPPDLFI